MRSEHCVEGLTMAHGCCEDFSVVNRSIVEIDGYILKLGVRADDQVHFIARGAYFTQLFGHA